MSRPWMPLYIADYLSDTQHLSATESGAYLHLLMHFWQHGELPTEDERLCRIAKVHPPHWGRVRKALEPFFGNPKTGGLTTMPDAWPIVTEEDWCGEWAYQ